MEVSHFNLRRLQAHTRIQERLIRHHLFVNDAALVTNSEQALQSTTSCSSDASRLFGLVVCHRKTVILQPPIVQEEQIPPHVTIGDVDLISTQLFTYLGYIITFDHLRPLNHIYLCCLRIILNIRRSDFVINVKVLEQAEIPNNEAMLWKYQLRLAGHASRMDDHRIPKIFLHDELFTGHRERGAPKKRYKDCSSQHVILTLYVGLAWQWTVMHGFIRSSWLSTTLNKAEKMHKKTREVK